MDKRKLDKFPAGVLEHVSRVMGDSMTGSEIAQLIRQAGYPEKSQVLGTKWRFLFALFDEFNSKPDGQYHVAKIVQSFSHPTRWIGKQSDHVQVMNALNEGLSYVGLQLNEKGELVITQARMTLVPEAQFQKPTSASFMTICPVFGSRDTKQEERLCFVLMPFKASFDRLYKDSIKPTIESSGFRCLRADDLYSPRPILEDIWTHICKSKVLIADVTGKNPNVFYEIGIAHTVGRPVIIITQDKGDVPFDLAQYRYFIYSDDSTGWQTLRGSLTSSLKSVS